MVYGIPPEEAVSVGCPLGAAHSVFLTRDGEPLVHPQLEDFIGLTTSRNIATAIGSNGSLITKKRAHKLISNGLSIMKGDFCVDKDEYETLRAGAKYKKALEKRYPQNAVYELRVVRKKDTSFI